MNVRSLVVFLRQYYRVGGGSGRTPPSNSPLHRLGYGGCSTTTPNYYYLMMNPGLRMFSSSNTQDNPYNPNPLLQNREEDGKKDARDPLGSSKFNILTWAKWIIGSMLSLIFPFLKGELEGIRKIEGKVEGVAEEVEEVAEVVETVATTVENVIGRVADKIPANTPLKEAVEAVEHASAHLAQDAHYITTFIHQVEDVKDDIEKLEKMIGPLVGNVTKDCQQLQTATTE
ncbi:unnamed protein product [Cuscuta campestris]|uniref:Uncharacterized protein n=1 Tax=Cuscuta campestris TaxID=132261 RepID=A0A484LZ56_9ASTE|nr:unnamed protein product [Cuscuta campestris]